MLMDIRKLITQPNRHMDVELGWQLAGDLQEFQGIHLENPVEITARLTNEGNGRIHLTGRAVLLCKGHCSRCLVPVRFRLPVDLEALFLPNRREEEESPDEEESLIYPYRGQQLALDEMIVEHLLPALPMQLLCAEDCRGLCPHCGANRNETSCTCEEEANVARSPFGKLKDLF